jgi:uncharacterized protein
MERIETVFLPGPAGRLECSLKHPDGTADPLAAAVVCHPHPLFGGTMHNKVVHAVSQAIVAAGLPVLRFNFRGVGGSDGTHDGGRGEQDDLRAVLDHLAGRLPDRPLLLAGYSFGASVALRVGCRDRRTTALIGIGTPVGLDDFGFLAHCARPLVFIQGEADPFGPLPLPLALASRLPGGARVVAVPGAGHGFTGHLDTLAARVQDAIPPDLLTPPA